MHENNAQYPRKISHKGPQNLAIEALEVHYRIHASILKYLEQHEGKPLKKSLGQLFQCHLKNCSEGSFMKYQSKLNDKKKDENGDVDKSISKELDNVIDVDKNIVTVYQRSNSIEEIDITDKTSKTDIKDTTESTKSESRKRSTDEQSHDTIKRIKLGSVSHLQLMQDVVALIDDLITKVCEVVSQKTQEKTCDNVTIASSNESDEAKLQKKKSENQVTNKTDKIKTEENKKNSINMLTVDPNTKTENVQDLMDALMKQAMEISQETQQSSPDDEDTRRFDGKWLQNEDLQSTVCFSFSCTLLILIYVYNS